jgi:hypothetical protein
MTEDPWDKLRPFRCSEADHARLVPLLARVNDPPPRDPREESRTCYRIGRQCLKWARDARSKGHDTLASHRVELALLSRRAARLWRMRARSISSASRQPP